MRYTLICLCIFGRLVNIMDKFEMLSEAINLAYDGKHKEAWKMVHNADTLVSEKDAVYNNLRDSVCTTLTVLDRMSRKVAKKDE